MFELKIFVRFGQIIAYKLQKYIYKDKILSIMYIPYVISM